jgi:hypothetical protein
MRGGDARTEGLFCYVSCEQRVPSDHPLRRVLPIVDAALAELSGEFARLYAPIGRPSIPLPAERRLEPLVQEPLDERAPGRGPHLPADRTRHRRDRLVAASERTA